METLTKLNIHDSVNKILTNKRTINGQQFNFLSFSREEVAKVLTNLDPHNSTGHD